MYAVGVAISPIPIATTLVLLTTRRALANGLSFVLGWIVGIAALTTLVVVLVHELGISDSDPVLFPVAELLIGAGFVLAAVAVWMQRHKHASRESPWLERVDGITTARSAGVGIVLSSLNPKVAALALGAAIALAEANAGAGLTAETVVFFSVIATAGILVPLAAYAAAPARAESGLRRFRGWLGRNEAVVLAALGLLLGGVFLLNGIQSL